MRPERDSGHRQRAVLDEVSRGGETPDLSTTPKHEGNVLELLRDIARAAIFLHRVQSGTYRYIETIGGQGKAGVTNTFETTVRAGYNFSIKRISVEAPAKTKIKIYEGRVAPDNLLWVGTQLKEAAVAINEGTGVPIEGPCQLIVQASELEAEGPITIRLEGDLYHNEITREEENGL